MILHQQLSFSGAQEMVQVLQEHYECCKAKPLKVRQCPNEIASETLIQNHVGYEMFFNYISPPACFSVDGKVQGACRVLWGFWDNSLLILRDPSLMLVRIVDSYIHPLLWDRSVPMRSEGKHC